MTNIEFDVLDELYFLQSYSYLVKTLDMDEAKLKSALHDLLIKGWIICYNSPTEELDLDQIDIEYSYGNYHYLASKAGLLAHNSNF